ncbi:MAG: histidine phosphatase family protein [Lachnospiraceae bacterium]|nr:histidine phosphatase family protein [Lachnospiraceae bacterium]
MRIDWIRHGEVPGNRERRYVGVTEESLTPEGIRAARALHPARPDMVFTSPRLRCRETAELLYPGIEPIVIDEFAECDFGTFEYRNYRELAGNPAYQAWIDSGGRIAFPGGEDRAQFQKRCLAGFRRVVEILTERGLSHAALVVHGGTIMAVMDRLSCPHRDYYDWQCGNLACLVTRYADEELYWRTQSDRRMPGKGDRTEK